MRQNSDHVGNLALLAPDEFAGRAPGRPGIELFQHNFWLLVSYTRAGAMVTIDLTI